nr:hypothetical protein [Mycoplasmopsis bovis]
MISKYLYDLFIDEFAYFSRLREQNKLYLLLIFSLNMYLDILSLLLGAKKLKNSPISTVWLFLIPTLSSSKLA